MIAFDLNGKAVRTDIDPDTPLLWAIRKEFWLTGTKYGCGIAACGAWTVHVDGDPVRSCSIPLSAAHGTKVVTIEGLSKGRSHPVQKAWIAHQVPQCGYCQSEHDHGCGGAARASPEPIRQRHRRCDHQYLPVRTYNRIREAIHAAARH